MIVAYLPALPRALCPAHGRTRIPRRRALRRANRRIESAGFCRSGTRHRHGRHGMRCCRRIHRIVRARPAGGARRRGVVAMASIRSVLPEKMAGLHKEAVESGRQNPTVGLPRGPRLPRFGERRVRGFQVESRHCHIKPGPRFGVSMAGSIAAPARTICFRVSPVAGGVSQRRGKTFVNSAVNDPVRGGRWTEASRRPRGSMRRKTRHRRSSGGPRGEDTDRVVWA
jgi:hypothetical protein